MEVEDKNLETSVEETREQPSTTESDEIQKVLNTLRKEREKAATLDKELKEAKRREEENRKALERYKAIDPEKYQLLLEEAARKEEQDLEQRRAYDELKTRYKTEAESAQKERDDWKNRYETSIVENAIRTAFFENGGRKPVTIEGDITIEDIHPVEMMINQLKTRVKLIDGRVCVVDRVGSIEMVENRPKTLSEKMQELRQGSSGALFEPINDSKGGGMLPQTASMNGKQVRVYTRAQAQAGKVPLSDIASGAAIIQG